MTDYITIDEAKNWLGIPLSDSTKDDIVSGLITTVSEAVDGWCEVSFALVPLTGEMHDARRQDVIIPKHWPLHSVQALYIGVSSDGTGGTLVSPDAYYADDVELRLIHMVMPLQRGYARLDYTYGFDGVPSRVKLAVKIGVEGYFRHRARQAVGITSKAKEGESINFKAAWDVEAGLPRESVSLLKQFRMIEWPGGMESATRNW